MSSGKISFGALMAVVVVSAVSAEHEPVIPQILALSSQKPTEFTQHPTDPSVRFVSQKIGRITAMFNGVTATGFLDIRERVGGGSENGLLGMAFPDNYPEDPYFYIHYSNLARYATISRFTHMPNDPLVGDPSSEEIILTVDQSTTNHNGGRMEFGNDGMLYLSLGDRGASSNGQDRTTLPGSILRLDVSGGAGSGYSIPQDNPFVGTEWRGEIWAFGLRNPWKFSFDKGPGGSGAMLIGDVGAGSREEVSLIPAGVGGLNFGWNCREGSLVHNDCLPPAGAPFVDPIFEYPNQANSAIIGGYVYRGAAMPCNRGRYFFGDYAGDVWSFALDDGLATDVVLHFNIPPAGGIWGITSLGRDASGELYVLMHYGYIYKIIGTGVTGDGDGDGQVDLDDFLSFHQCFAGRGHGLPVLRLRRRR